MSCFKLRLGRMRFRLSGVIHSNISLGHLTPSTLDYINMVLLVFIMVFERKYVSDEGNKTASRQ